MKTMYKSILVMLSLCINVQARENVGGTTTPDPNQGDGLHRGGANQVLSGCIPGKTQTELKLNDVRTRILTDGDMWWDLTSAKYEVPKGSNSMAQFAGSLWFGGYHNGELRISAMTYRQNGVDFWPGPLNPNNLSVDATACALYDKHYVFNRTDVDNFHSYWLQNNVANPATPNWIKDYPGNYDYGTWYMLSNNVDSIRSAGKALTMSYLAPYVDNNNDGFYNYADGDYPAYHVTQDKVDRGKCVRYLFGDQTIFWVFNDLGAKHSETGGNSIGVEIRAQAFEFSTGDELNQMSFYNYEVINWSPDKLDSTYFTVWDDCDLGNYQDDYIGCDVKRGLGYQYNGDNYDEDGSGQTGYHDKLPAIGCDFFQGPYADVRDGVDNDRDSCVDCSWRINQATGLPDYGQTPIPDSVLPEQIIMSRFTYYTNTGDPYTGNPRTNTPSDYYNYMNGKWRNGVSMTYGGNGFSGTEPCKFLFPGKSDPNGWGLGYQPNPPGSAAASPVTPSGSFGSTGWTQKQAGVQKADMRFLQSCGKFTLQPGAVNYVTYGIPFARSNSADNEAPIALLQSADDKAQALFDNCFKVLDGPDAPDLSWQELSNQIIFTLSNKPGSNNMENQRYAEADPTIQPFPTLGHLPDNVYRFEGYMVFQLKDETVGATELYNTDKARLVFQCDIKNGVKQLINYTSDPTLGIVPQLMVTGADAGIQNSFVLTEDKFASADPRMVNFRTYYYMAVAYAYNNYLPYVQDVSPTADTSTSGGSIHVVFSDPSSGDKNGQKKPYLQGRKNIKVISAIPHDPSPEANGSLMNSNYGIGPQITRVEGQGNGGFALDLTDQSVNDILNSPVNRAQNITYAGTRGPIGVKVTDPLRVVKGDFTLKFIYTSRIKDPVTGDSVWQYSGTPASPIPTGTLTTGSTSVTPVPNGTLDTGKIAYKKYMRWYLSGTYTDGSGNSVNKTWQSDEGINVGQEKVIMGASNEPLGFSVTIRQVNDPNLTAKRFTTTGPNIGNTVAADLLESSITYANPSTLWLGKGGIPDQDGSSYADWILAGGGSGDVSGHYGGNPGTKVYYADAEGTWEKVVDGTWAPFRFAKGTLSNTEWGPQYGTNQVPNGSITNPDFYADTRLLSSVDIVYTSDKSKWTHCPVVDMNTSVDIHTGIPYKWNLRRQKSWDKNTGTYAAPGVDPVSDSSMSWFPGYAINIETGERLNIIFAENSKDTANRGHDMMWNPTGNLTDSKGTPILGGMHFVYICGHNADGNFTINGETIPSDVRRYDLGKSTFEMLRGLNQWNRNLSGAAYRINKYSLMTEVFKDIMWCSMPASFNHFDISTPSAIPCDVKIKIRVVKPYRYGLSTVTLSSNTTFTTSNANTGIGSQYLTTPFDTCLVNRVAPNQPEDLATTPVNGNFPMYSFNTSDLAPKTGDVSTAKDALAKINVVPNPYYGHSQYEKTRIDNVVKLINLPVKCKIRIYTLAGTLVRTLEKDNDQTYLNWDLKNDKNVLVASGLYIIHIDAPGIGERILKWFGVMRPYDLQSY